MQRICAPVQRESTPPMQLSCESAKQSYVGPQRSLFPVRCMGPSTPPPRHPGRHATHGATLATPPPMRPRGALRPETAPAAPPQRTQVIGSLGGCRPGCVISYWSPGTLESLWGVMHRPGLLLSDWLLFRLQREVGLAIEWGVATGIGFRTWCGWWCLWEKSEIMVRGGGIGCGMVCRSRRC